MSNARSKLALIGVIGAVVIAVAAAAVLRFTSDRLDLSDDPRGEEACDALVMSKRYEGDVEIRLGSLLSAGEAASKARTEEIRQTADPIGLEDFAMVDEDALQEVCERAGVDFPK